MESITPRPDQMQAVLTKVPRGVPVVMLNMLRFRETADYPDGRPGVSGREAYAHYSEAASRLVAQVGGSLVWIGDAQGSVIGPPDEQWDRIFLVRYPSIETFLDMIGSAAYREIVVHRSAALLDSRLIVTVAKETP
jgi:uncharacterized protein (DUF1330 family)